MKLVCFALASICFLPASFARGPRLELTAPGKVTSNQPVTLHLSLLPATQAASARDFLILTTAGKVRDLRPADQGGFEATFAPPLVAQPLNLTLTASAVVAGRKLRVSKVLTVEPPAIQVGEVLSGGPFDLRAPDPVLLGENITASVTLQKPTGSSSLPQLIASSGRILGPKEIGEGRLAATYEPSAELFPRFAILAAGTGNWSVIDWFAIPLHGQARVDTKTEPGAFVTVSVGSNEYGPFLADKKGRVSVDVIVPPGVRLGTTTAEDALGNRKKTPLDLQVPAVNRLLALCPQDDDRLRILVIGNDGKPQEDAPLMLSTKEGRLGTPTPIAPGVYEVIFTMPDDAAVGESIQLQASLRDDRVSSAVCAVQVKGKPPANVQVSLSTSSHVAGETASVSVAVELRDLNGREPQGASIDLFPDYGKVTNITQAGRAKLLATWELPDLLQGRTKATIRASTRTSPPLSSEATLELLPGKTARLLISNQDSWLVADGQSTTRISARAEDGFGNPVLSARLTTQAAGTVGPFTGPSDDGTFQAVYTTPSLGKSDTDRIVVRETETGTEATLPLTLTAPRSPLALGARVGYGTNFGKVSSVAVGLDATVHIPFLRDFSMGIEVGYYGDAWANDKAIDIDTGGSVDLKVMSKLWVLPILARLVYELPLEPLVPYLALGIGCGIVSKEIQSESTGRRATRRAHVAATAAAGAGYTLGPGKLFLEVGYLYVDTDEVHLRGTIGGLLTGAGYRLEF